MGMQNPEACHLDHLSIKVPPKAMPLLFKAVGRYSCSATVIKGGNMQKQKSITCKSLSENNVGQPQQADIHIHRIP